MPLQFTQPIHHGLDPLHTTPPQPKRPPGLNIGTYNIRDGRAYGLPQAIRAVQLGNYDFMVVTETKIQDQVYCKNRLGYDVVVSQATPGPNGGAQGGVGLITREDKEGWDVESTRFHGPNVVSCVVVSGSKRMPMIGVYLPPSTLDHLPDLEEAINRFPQQDPIIMGDLNADIHDLSTNRSQQVAAFLATFGLLDVLTHFKQRRPHRHNQTWRQVREGQVLRSRCDYILGTDRRLFESVGIRDPRHYSSDHLAVKARLLRSPTRCHNRYLRGRKQFPLQLPTIGPIRHIDHLYQDLKAMEVPPPAPPRPVRPQWMSADTVRLIDTRAALRRNPRHNRNQARALTNQLKRSLQQDSRRRAEQAAEEIGALMDVGPDQQPDLKGSYEVLKRWYRHATARQPKPSRQDLTKISNDYAALYTKELPSPPGVRIPSHVVPFPINDAVPDEGEIQTAVARLKTNRAGGHSHLRAEHFKDWHAQAYPTNAEQEPNRHRWDKLVAIVQHIWSTGELPTELSWTILAIIPKGQHDSRGIGLIEVLLKLLEAIIDTRIKETVQFHDVLHGFRAHRGTGSAILEVKLFMELASIQLAPLYLIFLDLRKAYDTLDRERLIATLRDYGAGPCMTRLLEAFWDNQQVVVRQQGYHGPAFSADRGSTQGGLASPTLFNMVVDAVIRHWLSLVLNGNGDIVENGLGHTVADRLSILYADDGLLGARDDEWLQGSLNVLVSLFRRFGLQANVTKTKAMTCFPGATRQGISPESYARRMTGVGDTYRERLRRRVTCPECNKELAAGSLRQHRRMAHGIEPGVNWDMLPVSQAETEPVQYDVSFPTHVREVQCPICPGRCRTRAGLRNHFGRRHWNDILCITEEIYPFPRCEKCGHQVPPTHLNNRHYNTDTCRLGAQRKRRREQLQQQYEANQVVINVNGTPLEKVGTFVYLGRPIAYNNSDWPAIHRNLKRAQQRWGMVSRVLERTGASPRVRGMFYKAVVQAVLLYGCESWVITDSMRKVLEGFHHRIARRISGLVAQRIGDNQWEYPPIADALEAAGLWTMKEYIRRRQATVEQYIATRPIYQLCTTAETQPGTSRFMRWWQQDHSEDQDEEVEDGGDSGEEEAILDLEEADVEVGG